MPVRFQCPVCQDVMHVPPSDAAKRKFCSMECAKSSGVLRLGATTHGQSRTRLYRIWNDMKGRCHGAYGSRPGTLGYQHYASRGIVVCDEWRRSFVAFRDWALSHGYADTLTIDRIDPNGNYCASNCRWATHTQQMANTRKRADAETSRYRGVSWHAGSKKWRAQGYAHGKPVHLGCFLIESEAAAAYNNWASTVYGEFASLNHLPPKEGAPQPF